MTTTLPYQKHTLKNGVRLIMIPMHGIKSVASAVLVGVGSRYETAEINGISHFLEHMVFKGTKKYPTTEEVNIIERVGGLQNAYTDIDVTNYHNKVMSDDWELGLDINKELATQPRLPEEWVAKERDVIIEEMKRYEDEPAAKVEETFHGMLYPHTKLGMRIIGTSESLHHVGQQELATYHAHWYQPEKMVVVLAGDLVGKEDMVQKKVEEWFGGLEANPVEKMEEIKDAQSSPQLGVVTKPDAQQAHLVIGLRTFRRSSEERFAWNVFNLLMGVGFTSRLFKEVREKMGLCYHIRSDNSTYADVGNWNVYAGVATAKVAEAARAIMDEIRKARESGVTEDEVLVAKKRLKTIVAFRSEDPEFYTEWFGRQEVYNQPLLTLDDYLQKIEAVEPKDINALIHKYFVTKHLNMALVWNQKRDEKLLKILSL